MCVTVLAWEKVALKISFHSASDFAHPFAQSLLSYGTVVLYIRIRKDWGFWP